MKQITKDLFLLGAAVMLASCSSLRLDRVEYAWPVESVVTVTPTNLVEDVRYGLTAGVASLATEEFQDSTALRGAKLRVIRSAEGYYFLTGPKFKHVYVFAPGASSLSLYKAITISETGLKNPALNQRQPYVEVIDGDAFHWLLTADAIQEVKK